MFQVKITVILFLIGIILNLITRRYASKIKIENYDIGEYPVKFRLWVLSVGIIYSSIILMVIICMTLI